MELIPGIEIRKPPFHLKTHVKTIVLSDIHLGIQNSRVSGAVHSLRHHTCERLVCTAGFESVCEAMYLDKPVMMVPVKGHYEQYCNARDASRIGAGIYSGEFDLSKLEECFLFYNKEKNEQFRNWVNSFESQLMNNIGMLIDKTETTLLASASLQSGNSSFQRTAPSGL